MNWKENRILNNVAHPGTYEEVVIHSDYRPIVLSLWYNHPKAPTVIFLPGTMCHPLNYEPFLEGLAQGGFNVVGIHFLSHGKSPRISKKFTVRDFVQNVSDTISFVENKFDGPICLMGSSQGGILASYIATMDSRITLAFCHSVALPTQKEAIELTRFPIWLRRFRPIIYAGLGILAKAFATLEVPLDAYLDPKEIQANSHGVKEDTNDPLMLKTYPISFIYSLFSLEINPKKIKCPIIVMTTTGDKVFRVEYVKHVYEQFQAPAKELMIIPDLGHLCLMENADQVVAPILDKLWQYLD